MKNTVVPDRTSHSTWADESRALRRNETDSVRWMYHCIVVDLDLHANRTQASLTEKLETVALFQNNSNVKQSTH